MLFSACFTDPLNDCRFVAQCDVSNALADRFFVCFELSGKIDAHGYYLANRRGDVETVLPTGTVQKGRKVFESVRILSIVEWNML